jgi:hypothetical protein
LICLKDRSRLDATILKLSTHYLTGTAPERSPTHNKEPHMKISRMACFLLCMANTNLIIGCRSTRDTSATAESGELSSASGSLTKEFFTGLTSAPGTPARQRAGAILESILMEKLYPRVPAANNSYEKESRDRTRRILNLTVEYLKSGTQCAPAQRIRVYRGLGTQNVLFHPQGRPEAGVHVFTDWSNLLTDEIRGGLFGGNALPGVRVFQGLDGANKSAIENIDWPLFFGMGRQIARARDPNDFINFGWEDLAMSHSVASGESPLISLALQPDVSNGFGPGFLVADICPERALPLENNFAFGETEIYVPLFILPEEVVRVEGLQCGLDIQNGRAKRSDCYPKPLTDSDPLSPATKSMRECYINFGHPIEYKPWGAREAVAGRFFGDKQAPLKTIFDGQTIAQARQTQTQALQQCTPSCSAAQGVVKTARERLSYPAVNEIDQKNHNDLENGLKDYLNLMKSKCPEVK